MRETLTSLKRKAAMREGEDSGVLYYVPQNATRFS